MDDRCIEPLLTSIRDTFDVMCGLPVKVGRAQTKFNNNSLADVFVLIGFSGEAMGRVVIAFDFETACKIATAFAGTAIDARHPDFAGVLGGLAKMVVGGARSQSEGLGVCISLPNVIVGRNHQVSMVKRRPQFAIPCSTEAGTFHVELDLVLQHPAPSCGDPQVVGVQE